MNPVPTADPTALRFATVARALGAAAHEAGLTVPAFRCPPRVAEATRTIRRYPGGAVVAVRLRDRPFPEVVTDMIDGVLATNGIGPSDASPLRRLLEAAVADGPSDEAPAPLAPQMRAA